MRNFLLFIPLMLLAAVIYLAINLGVFKDVKIEKGPAPEMTIVYKDHVGPYHKIGDVIKEVEAWAKTANIDCKRTFGEYFDNPQVVEHERLKSRGGCILTQAAPAIPIEFKSETIPSRNYYQAFFEGSPWIGPYKVYKKVYEKAAADNSEITGSTIEIYELISENRMQTTYLFPLK